MRDTSGPDARWLRATNDLRQRFNRQPVAPARFTPGDPPAQRSFDLFMGEQDFYNAASYVRFPARLCGIGKHCQVYMEEAGPAAKPGAVKPEPAGQLQPELADLVAETIRMFDEEVLPEAERRLGHVLDVDRDGRFTILFTPRLNKLANGKVSLGGMVRGSDFYRDLAAPYGNRCDMMFLSTDLTVGPFLRTLLAHEFTHAVIFSEHVFGEYQPELPRQDEESWLNEGLAHINEGLHAQSWVNLDYRVSAFLNQPEKYSLVVPDYYRAGLFRSHGHRGATYLFLRWCLEKYGEPMLSRLVCTNLCGFRNLEVATGRRFCDLFREWTIELATSGQKIASTEELPFGRMTCGPRQLEMPMTPGTQRDVTVVGSSAAYVCLHSPGKNSTRVSIEAEPGTDLQLTLIPLPENNSRLTVKAEKANGQVRLVVTALHGGVRLDGVAWEKLVPTTRRDEDTSFRPEVNQRDNVRAWFGVTDLKAGQSCISAAIPVPADVGPVIFKIAGTGINGEPASAWVTCD